MSQRDPQQEHGPADQEGGDADVDPEVLAQALREDGPWAHAEVAIDEQRLTGTEQPEPDEHTHPNGHANSNANFHRISNSTVTNGP